MKRRVCNFLSVLGGFFIHSAEDCYRRGMMMGHNIIIYSYSVLWNRFRILGDGK